MIRQPHCFHGVVARTTAPFRFTKNMAPTFYIGAKIIDNKQQIRTPFRLRKCSDYGVLVRVTGLEPALLSEAAPKTAVYANFTTPAYILPCMPCLHQQAYSHTPAYYSIFDFQPIGIIRKSTTVVTLPKADVYADAYEGAQFTQQCDYTTHSKNCQATKKSSANRTLYFLAPVLSPDVYVVTPRGPEGVAEFWT